MGGSAHGADHALTPVPSVHLLFPAPRRRVRHSMTVGPHSGMGTCLKGAEVIRYRFRRDVRGVLLGNQEGVAMETLRGVPEGDSSYGQGLEHGGRGSGVIGKWK